MFAGSLTDTPTGTDTICRGSFECYLGNTFRPFFWQDRVSLGSEQAGVWGWCYDPNLWSNCEQSDHCVQSAVSYTHTHTTNFVSKSSAFMSPPDSSFITTVVLLLCAKSVSFVWKLSHHMSLARLRRQTKWTVSNRMMSLYFNKQHWNCTQVAKYITLSIWYLFTVSAKYNTL